MQQKKRKAVLTSTMIMMNVKMRLTAMADRLRGDWELRAAVVWDVGRRMVPMNDGSCSYLL